MPPSIDVTAPQFPLISLADDVARLRQALAWQSGPTIVGAFLRRAVMTALGDDAANVVGLVYTAASGLDEGESVSALGGDAPPGPALANLTVDEHGFGRLPEDDFVGHFAADVDRVTARVMHTAQQPVSMSVFDDVVGTPAWRSLPPYYYARLELFRIDGEAHRLLDLVSRLERLKLRP